MKTILILSVLVLAANDSHQAFWDQFKAAVSKKDVDAIATLSKFPIGMSYGIPNVKSKLDLRKRYRKGLQRTVRRRRVLRQSKTRNRP
ncbi:MAG TPA: hypothetical protein VFB65_07060 [Pyrinomonadaceae bacterium]|nr:hypothetical protein [Pyrinomonadaceae bacterium]